MKFVVSLMASLLVLSSCASSKKALKTQTAPVPVPTQSQGSLAENAVEAIKAPAKSSVSRQSNLSLPGLYFSEIKILTETLAGPNCTPESAIRIVQSAEFTGQIQERDFIWPQENKPKSVFHVSLRAIGYDTFSTRFTIADGMANLLDLPYQIDVIRLPSSKLRIEFFGSAREIDAAQNPITSFSEVEKRGDCQITHNVNVFAENSQLFD